MTNRRFLPLIISFTILITSCNKESNNITGSCWQGTQNGYDVPGLLICDKTKAEAEALHPMYWFYNASEPKFCWQVHEQTSVTYLRNMPQSVINTFGASNSYTYTKVSCNGFCTWKIIQKRKSKVTGQYANATKLFAESFMADSCNKIFQGRIITYQETADSLITREFFEKQP